MNIVPVQADEGNLADKAVAFIKTDYQTHGAQNDMSTHYPYIPYVLQSTGVDVSGWVYNGIRYNDAVYGLVDTDIHNNMVSVKHLAQDLISMQAWGNTVRVGQLQELLRNRQNNDGSFLNDSSAYSIIPAYELLGRAGQLALVNTAYAQAYILGQQNPVTGAWPGGAWPDFMTTAQAVRALAYLAPGAAADSDVGQAISRGCTWLQSHQKTDGSFTPSAWDDPLIDTAEAIATQKVLGLNPAAAWTSSGKSGVDYLNNSALNADGSLGLGQNLMDATWVLDSCQRLGILPSGSNPGGGATNPLPAICTPGIAVVGMNGELLYGPASVTISGTNTWGKTVLGALEATGLAFHMSQQWTGFVESIGGQANSGNQGWMYTVNNTAPVLLAKDYKVSSVDQIIWYYSKSMDQLPPTWAQLSSGSYAVPVNPQPVTSASGIAEVYPSAGGNVGLGNEAKVDIPAGALNGTNPVKVTVEKNSSPPTAPAGFSLLGTVYNFSVANQAAYQFNQPVTLIFSFDPQALETGQTPVIYYYDDKSRQWISLGGTVSGTTISVKVDHFTSFAVFAKKNSSVAAPLPEKNFIDVPASFWASQAIKDLYSHGYIGGYPDGCFKPENNISRAEFVTIINKILKLSKFTPVKDDFQDAASTDWFYEPVENAVHAKIIKGYGQVFLPHKEISREELAIILVNALGKQDQVQANMKAQSSFKDDAAISSWSRGYVIVAAQEGLLKGYPDQTFNPQGKATRAEACSMIKNYQNKAAH